MSEEDEVVGETVEETAVGENLADPGNLVPDPGDAGPGLNALLRTGEDPLPSIDAALLDDAARPLLGDGLLPQGVVLLPRDAGLPPRNEGNPDPPDRHPAANGDLHLQKGSLHRQDARLLLPGQDQDPPRDLDPRRGRPNQDPVAAAGSLNPRN